jgi:hypothetical protein
MTDPSIATIVSGILCGLIGGTLAFIGAVRAVRAGVKDLEATELRRQKLDCILNLHGLRYVLSERPAQRDEDRTRFMFEMGRASALFAEDAEVQKGMRDFHDAIKRCEPEPQRTDRFISLIKQMSKSARCPLQALSDTDVRNVFLLQLQNPLGAAVIIQQIPQNQGLPQAGTQKAAG